MSQIIRKNLVLSSARPDKSPRLSQITDCVNNFASGIPGIHHAWSNTAEFSICLYFLTKIVGSVALLLLLPALSKLQVYLLIPASSLTMHAHV